MPEPFGSHYLTNDHPYTDEHTAEYSVKPLQ